MKFVVPIHFFPKNRSRPRSSRHDCKPSCANTNVLQNAQHRKTANHPVFETRTLKLFNVHEGGASIFGDVWISSNENDCQNAWTWCQNAICRCSHNDQEDPKKN